MEWKVECPDCSRIMFCPTREKAMEWRRKHRLEEGHKPTTVVPIKEWVVSCSQPNCALRQGTIGPVGVATYREAMRLQRGHERDNSDHIIKLIAVLA